MERSDQRRRANRDRSNEGRRGYEADDDQAQGERQFGGRGEERGSRERGGSRDEDSRDEHHTRGRESARSGRGSGESAFSPDWSRDETEPLYSDDPYYLRNREYQGRSERSARYYGRGREHEWRGDENRRTTSEQRERGFTPHGAEGEDDGSRGRDPVTRHAYPGGRGALYVESWTIPGPYTGRGPKGYKRSNEQIVDEASLRLEHHGQIDATEIEVSAENGVITLRGTVPDRAMKRRAEECVESIYGVHDVANELRVARPESEQSQGAARSRGSQSLGAQYSQMPESHGSRSASRSQSTRGSRTAQGSQGQDKKSRKDKQH